MNGLILKDWYTLRQMGRTYLIAMACILVWAWTTKNPSVFTIFLVAYGLALVMTAASYDEMSRFNRYALTLPLTPKEVVRARYLFLMLLFVGLMTLGLLGGSGMMVLLGTKAEMSYGEFLITSCATDCVYLLVAAFLLPCIYRFGVEKSRFLFLVSYLAGFVCLWILAKLEPLEQCLSDMGKTGILCMLLAAGLLGLVCLVLSCKVSEKILEKKEW